MPLPSQSFLRVSLFGLLAASFVNSASGQSSATRLWSVGPLTQAQTVMGITVGPGGGQVVRPMAESQTRSVFNATRRVIFAGDRIVLASAVGTRNVEGKQVPETVYQLLSLDAATGKVRDAREVGAFGSLNLFASSDGRVIVSGKNVQRLRPNLEDDGVFDYAANGIKSCNTNNISPDGTTLGVATYPGFQLLDSRTFKATRLTTSPVNDASLNATGLLESNVQWLRDYPRDEGFITFVDADGQHLLWHGPCDSTPQFLSNGLILNTGCKNPLILDARGAILHTIALSAESSFAGVSQNGKRFALQIANGNHERFAIYTTETGELIAEVAPDIAAEGQSWTAFSPDGYHFVIGSPQKLTLYQLP